MFKQLDLFAIIPDESKKQDEKVATASEQAEALTTEQDNLFITEAEESFTAETVNEPENTIQLVDAISEPGTIPAKEKQIPPKKEKRQGVTESKPVKGKRGRKSLKAMEEESDSISIPADEVLFTKQYYSIGEVAQMFQLNTSLLRYWETEFDIIKPRKNRKGDRHFRPEDIKNLYLIHHLLRQRKYTIEGAKDYLKKNKSKAQQNFEVIQRLQKLKGFLLELKAGL